MSSNHLTWKISLFCFPKVIVDPCSNKLQWWELPAVCCLCDCFIFIQWCGGDKTCLKMKWSIRRRDWFFFSFLCSEEMMDCDEIEVEINARPSPVSTHQPLKNVPPTNLSMAKAGAMTDRCDIWRTKIQVMMIKVFDKSTLFFLLRKQIQSLPSK